MGAGKRVETVSDLPFLVRPTRIVQCIRLVSTDACHYEGYNTVTGFLWATESVSRPRPQPLKARRAPHAPRRADIEPGIYGSPVKVVACVRLHHLPEKSLAILHFPKVSVGLLTWIPGPFMTWV